MATERDYYRCIYCDREMLEDVIDIHEEKCARKNYDRAWSHSDKCDLIATDDTSDFYCVTHNERFNGMQCQWCLNGGAYDRQEFGRPICDPCYEPTII